MTVTASQSVSYEAWTLSVSRASAPPPSRAERRAEALMTALDADKDGAVTSDEFTSGARALLKAGSSGRTEGHDDNGRHQGRGLGRLERRLERAFERVDANDDGAVDAAELTSAFSALGRRRRGGRDVDAPPPPDAPTGPTAGPDVRPSSGGSVTTVQISFVAVAIRSYTTVQASAEGPAPTAEMAPGKPVADPVMRSSDHPAAGPWPEPPPVPSLAPVPPPIELDASPVPPPSGPVASPVSKPPSGPVASPVSKPPSGPVASPVAEGPSGPVASPVTRPGATPGVMTV
jgi:EF hand